MNNNLTDRQTGYATLDRPWERFYEGIEQKTLFLNTTPYIGLVENNKGYPDEIAIEYFGAKITFGKSIIRSTVMM